MGEEFDLAVIGSGPGGYVAAIRGAQLGLKVACIEKRKTFGGTCLNVGCIPSKSLLHDSELYEIMEKKGRQHGLEFSSLASNISTMMQRKSGVVKANTDGVAFLFKKNKITSFQGEARLVAPNKIQVGKETVQAKNIILATGSEPIELPMLPFDEKKVLSSTGALELEKIPEKMAVIGGGVIGVEIASIYRRLGSDITIIEMLPQICTGLDDALTKAFHDVLIAQGLKIALNTKVASAKIEEQKVTLSLASEHFPTLEADVVLVAVGRKAASKNLGLEELGIKISASGQVIVNDSFQTNLPNIYAIGDLIDGPMLAHKASEEGVAAAEIIAGEKAHINYLAVPNIIYTSPEVAALGFTEQEAKNAGLDIFTGTCPFKANPRARCIGEPHGFVKVIGDKLSGKLLGMHILGINASELISEGVLAISKGCTVKELAALPNGHPTLSEAVKEACLIALKQSINT